jgi:hypothetical protein
LLTCWPFTKLPPRILDICHCAVAWLCLFLEKVYA